jgi:uncharacterized RDD family membrane protein YckC
MFIFRPDQRCIHDFLAGTKVIDKVSFLAGAGFREKAESRDGVPVSEDQKPSSAFELDRVEEKFSILPLQYDPATRSDRFLGYLIDKISILVAFVILIYIFERFFKISFFSTKIGTSSEFILSFLLLNSYFLIKNQQTLGKLLLGTKIIGLKRTKVPFFKVFFFRELLFWGPWPFVTIMPEPIAALYYLILLVNSLLIYREDRRCLHDWISQTCVVYIQKRGGSRGKSRF